MKKRKVSNQEATAPPTAPTPPPSSAPTRAPFNWDLTIKLVALVISAATLGFGIYQFVLKPGLDTDAELRRSKQELYNQAMASAAAFANASTQTEADTARKQFWELYYGKLSAVENQEVKEAMQAFGGGVKSWEGFNDPDDFTKPADFEYVPPGQKQAVSFSQMSYRLTQVCRADLGVK